MNDPVSMKLATEATQAVHVNGVRGRGAEVSSYTRRDGAGYVLLIGAATALVALAYRLRPAAEGFGTHRQLGLPPCPFLTITGLPCPGCGLTTSFAHMSKFNPVAAFAAQPFGVYAFVLTLMLIPLSAYLVKRRVSWQMAFELRAVQFALRLSAALLIAGWIYKLAHV